MLERKTWRSLSPWRQRLNRNAVLKNEQSCRRENKHSEGSDAWHSDIKVAMARLQQKIESLELQEQGFCQSKQRCDIRIQTYKACETSAVHVKDRSKSSKVERMPCRKPSGTCRKPCKRRKKRYKVMHNRSRILGEMQYLQD